MLCVRQKRQKSVWILVPPGSGLLNLCGAWEVFSHANDVLQRAAYALALLGPTTPQIQTGHGLVIGNVEPLPNTPSNDVDVVIVAGGSAFAPATNADLEIARWLEHNQRRLRTIVSICAGAFTLGHAGLLDGRRATTHWMALDRLRKAFPGAKVVDDGIYVQDGRVWTSAGITAGIDLCLALVERDFDHRVAMQVAQRLVLFLRRSGNQAQFSAALERQTKATGSLRELTAYIIDHIGEDLRVESLAQALGTSPRTLSRQCKAEFGESPAELVRRLRVEEAARQLSATDLPLKAVAAQSGLGDASTLWRVFDSEYGITPDEYRQRFSSALATPAG